MFPQDPIAAVTHLDPYPYYADLVARRPLYYDDKLRLWVASSANAVTAALTNGLCRVRPAAEPIPKSLLGSPAAEIFRHLVRMNDGERHCPFKQSVSAALAPVDVVKATQLSVRWARFLLEERGPNRLSRFAFHLPVYVMGSLIGVPEDMLSQTALWMDDFARCLAPASDPDQPDQIERGKAAAGHLLQMFRDLPNRDDGLLSALAREAAGSAGAISSDGVIANSIGFLSQSYEATAGLIGNTLLALAFRPEARDRVATDPEFLHSVIQEVLRYDSPVQNTRRFLAEDGFVAGEKMKAGDAILVILAAANHDPSANPNPERFDVFRKKRQIFTFGVGAHACPGEALATTIANAGVGRLIASGVDLERLAITMTYRASANVRIPIFKER
ncbi:MAG TPA: cytochrome P450 [Blastocatellia bacterium]|jgi:cytochrome P450|nr:cytochrome P450 [Blastocatellia bacterium]